MTVTIEHLRRLFCLDCQTGTLTWRERQQSDFKNLQAFRAWNTRYAGKPAGSTREDGYIAVRIDGRKYLLHRLVFAIYHGLNLAEVPAEIDHSDANNTNNAPSNLRAAAHDQNLYNVGIRANNTSGFKGVSWMKRLAKWEARIRAGGKRHHLGYFSTPEDAHIAYSAAANDKHGTFARPA